MKNRKVSRSASTGKFVDAKTAAKNKSTTVTEKITSVVDKEKLQKEFDWVKKQLDVMSVQADKLLKKLENLKIQVTQTRRFK